MHSSIFNFDYFRRYRALPPAERRWHAILVAVLVVVALVCYQVPALLFGRAGCPGPTLEGAAVDSLSDRTGALFVGSSHFLFGIRPRQYSVEAANLATTWLDYTCARRVIEKNLPRAPHVKTVVIEYDELPLVSDLVPAAINAGDLRSLTELDLSPLELPTDHWLETVQALYVAARFRLTTLPRLTPLGWEKRTEPCGELQRPQHDFAAGYYYTENVTPPNFDRAVVFRALSADAQNESVVRRNLAALQQTIAALRRRGVFVVLLRLPHRPEYARGLPPSVRQRWQELRDRVQLDARDDQRIVVLDWGARPEFQDGDFCDDHHLNVFGANKLARLLDPELSRLCRAE